MKRCLVVDDSRVIRRVAAKIVHELGFAPEEAANGRAALEACGLRMPDIILLDWEMPVVDGLAVARALRQMPGGEKVKILFCTTRNETADIREALAAGADEYIMKPFDSEIVESKFQVLGLLP